MIGADDGIAADADASGLADAEAGQLVDRFVSERAAAADDADVALFVDAARHDADFTFAGGDDARAIGADEARFCRVDSGGGSNHVDYGNAFGDADDQRNFGVGGFENSVGREGRRDENDAGVGSGMFHGVGNGIKYRALEMFGTAFSGSDSADYVRSIFDHLLRVEGSLPASESLNDDSSLFVDENAHRAPPASATTFVAPSFMPSAMVKLKPLSRRIF